MARRIKKAKIEFISLCQRGINGMRTIYKSEDKSLTLSGVSKALPDFDEKGQIVACVYAPNRIDKEQDWADEGAIRDMAHGYMREGAKVDVRHNDKALDRSRAYVAESFIIQKGDPRFEGISDHNGPFDATGGWGVLIQVDDPELRKAYRNGDWAGVSMGGHAIDAANEEPLHKGIADFFGEWFRKFVPGAASGDEDDMKPEDLKKAVEDGNATLAKTIVEGLKSVMVEAGLIKKADESKPDEKTKDDDVDLTDPEAVEAHIAKLETAKINKRDPVALRKHLASLRKAKPEGEETAEGIEDAEQMTPELKKALAEVERLKKASNQPADATEKKAATKGSPMKKEDLDAFNAGKKAAQAYNQSRGLETAKA